MTDAKDTERTAAATVEEDMHANMTVIAQLAQDFCDKVLDALGPSAASRITLVAPAILAARILAEGIPASAGVRSSLLHGLIDAVQMRTLGSFPPSIHGGN
jgi:hypothetical protein